MKEHKINAVDVNGTGKDGRITKEDVMAFLEKGKGKAKETKVEKTVTPTSTTPK